jgi:AraC-like DNA-binding protein
VSQNCQVTAAVGVSADDLDEALDLCRKFYYPVRMTPIGPMDGFRFSFRAARVGALTVGTMHYSRDLRVSLEDLAVGYNVTIPVTGRMVSTHRGVTVIGERGRAVLYQPLGESRLDPLPSDCRLISINIERAALDARLAEVLGDALSGPLAIAPSMDVSRGAGRSWAQLAELLAADVLRSGGGLAGSPMVAERLAESLINGLLLAVDHPFRDALTRPERSWRPRPLRRAVEAMLLEPAHPFNVVELAQLAEVSVRSLQAIFHRHTGLTPMAYLRELRLANVHEELRQARPDQTTVAAVAHRWGFGHLGRFAAAYRGRYGVSPSVTLRLE